jgi:D-sedoheptulose 7-phosphate isomerase
VFFGDATPLRESLRAAPDVADFARRYFDRLRSACASVDPASIAALLAELERARDENATVWVIGNGGSASAASHIANGLGGYMALRSGRGHRIVALTDPAALSGLSNDSEFANVFVAQLVACHRKGDRLLALSCSGNSANIVRAAAWVRAGGDRVIGMTGFDGGSLLPLCDLAVHVRSDPGEYGPVEDAHMAIAHVLVHWLQRVPA